MQAERASKRSRREALPAIEATTETAALESIKERVELAKADEDVLGDFEEFFTGPRGAYRLMLVLRKCNISLPMLDRARACTYEMMCPLYGLDPEAGGDDIPNGPMQRSGLPVSLWRSILRSVDQIEDDIGHLAKHENEAAREKWIAAWLTPIVALFESRILNHPERPIPGYRTGGGEVELQYWIKGQCLLVIIEVKYIIALETKRYLDGLAQLLAELDAAAYKNQKNGLAVPELRGVLTDGSTWVVVAFNTENLTISLEKFSIRIANRAQQVEDMLAVINVLFNSFLKGWFQGLRAYHMRSDARGEEEGVRRVSTVQWGMAEMAASQALSFSAEQSGVISDEQGQELHDLLHRSLQRFRLYAENHSVLVPGAFCGDYSSWVSSLGPQLAEGVDAFCWQICRYRIRVPVPNASVVRYSEQIDPKGRIQCAPGANVSVCENHITLNAKADREFGIVWCIQYEDGKYNVRRALRLEIMVLWKAGGEPMEELKNLDRDALGMLRSSNNRTLGEHGFASNETA
ncbi:hypothetical protein HDU88_003985 [Geranomyces variabilis]|nr:hypothetical protein HDU88_003985 [Geranomyces variabilis]